MTPAPGGQPTVALLSGGIDSALMLAHALDGWRWVYPLYVRQDFLWEEAELRHLRRLLEACGPRSAGRLGPLALARVSVPAGYPARWAVDPAAPVPESKAPDEAVHLPGRNLALLLQGGLLAQALGVRSVMLGTLDTSPFADSAGAFMERFAEAFGASAGHGLELERPLAGRSKPELVAQAKGVPLHLTFSCLRPVAGRHCGRCNKCEERRRVFRAAQVEDPTEYA